MVLCGLYCIRSVLNQFNGLSAWKRDPGPTEMIGSIVLEFSPVAFSAEAQTAGLLMFSKIFSFFSFCIISHLRIQNVCQKGHLVGTRREKNQVAAH